MRVLCLDFGNSFLKAAVLANGLIESRLNIKDSSASVCFDQLKSIHPDSCILSSVIRHEKEIESLISSFCPIHVVSSNSRLNFSLAVEQPDTVGSDRLALIAGAIKRFPEKSVLVISMGTCITYSFVNKAKQFTGGAITPGVNMRFRAMHQFTSKLPDAEFIADPPMIGKNTLANLQSGVYHGVIGELNQFIQYFIDEFDEVQVILTGGNAPYFAERLKRKIFADPDLMLHGLYALAEINV